MQERERLCQWHWGKLVWGIADDDTLIGLADVKSDAEKISEAIKSHIDPIPDFKLSFAKCEDKDFVVLDVMSGAQTPYYYIGDGQMQTFVRVGNENVVASVAKHKELVLKGSHLSYDSQVSRWRFEDMAFTVLRATYFKRTNRSFEDSDYESFGIVNEKGEHSELSDWACQAREWTTSSPSLRVLTSL